MNDNNLPEELSPDELDEDYPEAETFTTDGTEEKSTLERAQEYAKEINGQLYTQVDVEDPEQGDIAYEKGNHLVNRTGVYAVIPLDSDPLSWKNYEKVQQFLVDYQNELHAGGMSSNDSYTEDAIKSALGFMAAIEHLFWECAKCRVKQRPNAHWNEVNEDFYCDKCLAEGI